MHLLRYCVYHHHDDNNQAHTTSKITEVDGFKTYVFTGWIAPTLHRVWQVHPLVYFGLLDQIYGETSLGNQVSWLCFKVGTLLEEFLEVSTVGDEGKLSTFCFKVIHKAWGNFLQVWLSWAKWCKLEKRHLLVPIHWPVLERCLGNTGKIEGIKSVLPFFFKWTSSGLGFVDVLVVVTVVSNLTGLRLGMVDLPALNNHLAKARWASEARKTVGVSQTLAASIQPRKLLTGYGFNGLNWRNEMLVKTRNPGHIARHCWLLQGEGGCSPGKLQKKTCAVLLS